MGKSLVTPPTEEPITLEEAKAQSHVDGAAHDAVLGGMIVAARRHAERFTRRAFMTQTWDYFADFFPKVIWLPNPRLQTVTSIKYTDTNGDQQTLDAADYTVDAITEPARIAPAFGLSWPTTRVIFNAVEIQFIAGYGDKAEDVPADIRHAMLLLTDQWFDNRSNVTPGSMAELPFAVQTLLWSHRVMTF